ncbi:MAG: hypothetical protein GXP49_01395 [Deltaproteobacteria bacterium]|nr:hypothetical protein [Deltaproteobacteria bacterium]
MAKANNENNTIRKLIEEGLYYLGLSNEEQALARWRSVLEKDPGNKRAREYIAFVQPGAEEAIDVPDNKDDMGPDKVTETTREQGQEGGTLSPAEPDNEQEEQEQVPPPLSQGAGEAFQDLMISSNTAPIFIPLDGSLQPDASTPESGDESQEKPDNENVEHLPETGANPEVEKGESPLLEGAKDLLEAGDYTEAYELVEKFLTAEPDNEEGLNLKIAIRKSLMELYKAELGNLDAVPVRQITDSDLVWVNLSPREAYLLSRVDGILTFGEIIDLMDMEEFEIYRLLSRFLKDGHISK